MSRRYFTPKPLTLLGLLLSLLFCNAARTSMSPSERGSQSPSKHEGSKHGKPHAERTENYAPCGTKVRASEVLVKFSASVPRTIVQMLGEELSRGAFRIEEVGTGAVLYLIHIDGLKATDLVGQFNALKVRRSKVMVEQGFTIERVEPNFIFSQDDAPVQNIPNDLMGDQQWGLLDSSSEKGGISAVSAWKTSQGSQDIVVGVVDTGVSYTHPDLSENMWCAPRAFTVQVAGQDISCPKGSHGFNGQDKTCNPTAADSHGSRVSGIIGARGDNGKGVVGVNWRTSMMALSWRDHGGLLNAISFAMEVKKQGDLANIRVLNNSYGEYLPSGDDCRTILLEEKIKEANSFGILFVASAGDKWQNNDNFPHYPSGLGIPNIISVAATTIKDELYSHSGHGKKTVDLGAPGSGIKSTGASNDYPVGGGTSYAAPFVSGAAALILSVRPTLTTADLKKCILDSADHVSKLKPYLLEGRRLNVNKAIEMCGK